MEFYFVFSGFSKSVRRYARYHNRCAFSVHCAGEIPGEMSQSWLYNGGISEENASEVSVTVAQ